MGQDILKTLQADRYLNALPSDDDFIKSIGIHQIERDFLGKSEPHENIMADLARAEVPNVLRSSRDLQSVNSEHTRVTSNQIRVHLKDCNLVPFFGKQSAQTETRDATAHDDDA